MAVSATVTLPLYTRVNGGEFIHLGDATIEVPFDLQATLPGLELHSPHAAAHPMGHSHHDHNQVDPHATTCLNHEPKQHRDGKPPWCDLCGLTSSFQEPVSHFPPRGVVHPNTGTYPATGVVTPVVPLAKVPATDPPPEVSRD